MVFDKMQKDWKDSINIIAKIAKVEINLVTNIKGNEGEILISTSNQTGEKYNFATKSRAMNCFINWSDKSIFGVLVVLNNKSKISNKYVELINQFKILMEKYLELLEKNEIIEYLASIDPLTKVYNRRILFEKFTEELSRSSRYNRELSILMIDIDYFKSVNDRYGHLVGDTVLEKVAQEINKMKRNADILGRYGGEEFIIIMPETSLENAHVFAERIKNSIREKTIGFHNIKVTVSIGVTQKNNDTDIFSMIERADSCLLYAKNNRNCVYSSDLLQDISKKTIEMMDNSMKNFKKGIVSEPISLGRKDEYKND